jgi:hypothetical protein
MAALATQFQHNAHPVIRFLAYPESPSPFRNNATSLTIVACSNNLVEPAYSADLDIISTRSVTLLTHTTRLLAPALLLSAFAPSLVATTPDEPPPATKQPNASQAKPAEASPSKFISIEVVDPQGQKLAGADVIVQLESMLPDNTKPLTLTAITDQSGRARIAVPSPTDPNQPPRVARIRAHIPGRGLAQYLLPGEVDASRKSIPAPARIVLQQPINRTITVKDADNRPVPASGRRPRPDLPHAPE